MSIRNRAQQASNERLGVDILSKNSAHGLRKIGATRAANNEATVAQLEALFGWSGGGMAALYTRSADRARLGRVAAKMLIKNDERTSMLPPDQKVGAEIAGAKTITYFFSGAAKSCHR